MAVGNVPCPVPPPIASPMPAPSPPVAFCDATFCYNYVQGLSRINTTYSGPGPYPGGISYKFLSNQSYTVPMTLFINGTAKENVEFRTDGNSTLRIESTTAYHPIDLTY